MPNEHVFRPRVNMRDMRAGYYDVNYIPDPNGQFGPTHSNPYDQMSNNPFIRTCNYLFGRWHEGGTYGLTRWTINTNLGYILELVNNQYSRHFYGTYDYWQQASINDYTDAQTGNTYNYFNTDTIGRPVSPGGVGQLVFYIDLTAGNQVYHAGLIEYFNGYADYYISHLNTSGGQHATDFVEIEHITNNEWETPDHRLVWGVVMSNYYSTMPAPQDTWPVRVGRPIGWKNKMLLYEKRYNDMRRGIY